jgi:sigma-E factor negative regulatory protein RseC
MNTEEGVVIRTDAENAWIKTVKTSACKSCSSRGACQTMGGGREMEVEAMNTADAQIGDRVVIGFETGPLLKVSFLIYIFPILALLTGAVIGQKCAPYLSLDPSASSMVFGFFLVFLSVLFIRRKGKQLAAEDRYHPKVIRILPSDRLPTA